MKAERKTQAKGKEVHLAEQSKVIDKISQWLSAMASKFRMNNISLDEGKLEESDEGTDIDFASDSDIQTFY